jgi:uncharacterized protein YndB with AHSA1/START domain
MRLDISMEERFPVPIDRVWQALTDPLMIARWLMTPAGYEARVGARFWLREDPHEDPREDCAGQVECEVLELVPPRRMVWSWRGVEDPATTRLVIELEAHGATTHLTLRHTGDTDERTARNTTRGWTGKLGALSELLTGEGDNGDG